MYKAYTSQKQEKEAMKKREVAIKKTVAVVIPIAAVLALTVIVAAKLKNKKLLKKQQEEANRKLGEKEQQHKEELRQRQTETEKVLENKEQQHLLELNERDKQHAEIIESERQVHRMEQAAILGKLKRRNEEVRELKEQIRRQDDLNATPKQTESFTDEPICRLIMERVNKGQFLSQMDCTIYKDYALSKEQIIALREAANRHFGLFTVRLAQAYPNLTKTDLDYCCLYLLGLTDADIAALMQRAYNTVNERNSKLRKVFGSENSVSITMQAIANKSKLI